MKKIRIAGMIPADAVRASGSAAKNFREQLEEEAKSNNTELTLFEVLGGGDAIVEFKDEKVADAVADQIKAECPDVIITILSKFQAIREQVKVEDKRAEEKKTASK
jgi:hypothetical protein